ncbi:MAG: PQQ-like beta-propeller repeat protein, partial [Candidatus Helarchaeota archaeon]|nr:PQQ-like beta-propeller repeat protein [Candidatus Helarchaeota archaeon]
MKKRTKLFSIGLLAMVLSLLFINGFMQLQFMYIGSNSGSNGQYPTFGTTETQYTVIYGNPTELTVEKTETVSIDIYPNGSVKTQRVTVNFIFENEADENCSFNLIDRAEGCDLDTIKFQKGTFPSLLPFEVIKSDEDFGVAVLKWSNITIHANSRAEYGYIMDNYNPIPLQIETEYWVNGSLIDIDPLKNEINASIGSFVSNIIRVRNIQQGLFSTSSTVKPTTICLITLILPYEEDEEDRDLDEVIYSTAPIMTTELGPIQQVTFIALGDNYEINWSTTVLKGGGWGIIELQPIMFNLIQISEITGVLFDGISALLGIVAAQQAYWAALTLMAMIEELMGMIGLIQILLNDIQTQLGMLTMSSYSLINCLLLTLVEIDFTKTSLNTIYTQLNDIYESNILVDYGQDGNISQEIRRILGMGLEGYDPILLYGSNAFYGIGTPYMSIPLILDYYSDIERRIIASFGAQLIEILGSPAIINFTSTVDDFSFIVNATATRMPDNTTDFYTLIDIANLTIPLAEIPLFGPISLNLTQRYEFELYDVPGNRTLFNLIDLLFGPPAIPFELFPTISGSPGSNVPGFYTWILDMLRIGKSALWTTIGNLTRSISTLMLLLDSSFSQETLNLINQTLSGSSAIDLATPITLETGFTGISDLMGLFSGMEEQFKSPFGSSFGDLMPDTGSLGIPVDGADMSLLENFEFWTALKIYMEPVPRIRQFLNITLPLDFGNMTGGMDMGDMGGIMGGLGGMMGDIGFIKSAENGNMGDWNWSYAGLTTVDLTQVNQAEDSLNFKRFQIHATGNVDTGNITLIQRFNYTIPANQVTYRLRTSDTSPVLSVVIVSQNATGHDVYAVQIHNLTDLSADSWHSMTYDLRSTQYWEYYDSTFDLEHIKGVELWITPHTDSTVNIDIDYINFSREIIPYPYDITILDGYLIGDGIEIFPNITTWDKWTTGLMMTAVQTDDMNDDGINDIIAGSNDGNVYLLNGTNGIQLWNFSAEASINNLFLEDLSGDSTPEIIIGTVDGNFYVINKTKGVLWNFSIGTNVDYLITGNLTGIGNSKLIIGTDNNIIVVNHTGNLFWNQTLKGTIRAIVADDLDGDGVEEIGVATSKFRIYVLNGTNGTILWDYITEERPTHLIIGNFLGNANQELLYSTDTDYCVILDGTQGTHIRNFTTDSLVRGIYAANLSNNAYDDILLHTGLVDGQNLSAFEG